MLVMSNSCLHSVTLEPQQMGSLKRLKGETRSHFVLAPIAQYENDNHFHCSVFPTPWGVDFACGKMRTSDKIMPKFERGPC